MSFLENKCHRISEISVLFLSQSKITLSTLRWDTRYVWHFSGFKIVWMIIFNDFYFSDISTMTSTLTRSYSCHGKIQDKCSNNKKSSSSVLLNNLINAQNLILSEDLMVEHQPRIIILQGRKIVRKKKRKCVKCKCYLDWLISRINEN